jgi:hypothetical protein
MENKKFFGKEVPNIHIKKRALLPLSLVIIVTILAGIFPGAALNSLVVDHHILNYHIPEHVKVFSMEGLISSFITITIGIFIYSFLVSGKIFKKEGENYIFLNPSLKWFNIEDNFYKPAAKYIYVVFGKIFKVIDNWVLNVASKSVDVLTAIGNIDVSYLDRFKFEKVVYPEREDSEYKNKLENAIEKGSQSIVGKGSEVKGKFENAIEKGSQSIVEKGSEVKGKLEESVEKKGKSFRESVSNANFKITNLTYSVFLFGIVLVASFIFIFLKSKN